MGFSIITINYNNREGLRTTINSVKSQVYPNLEYIIIDGGSSDGSVELIENNKQWCAYWISEKDNGIYHAMNKGIAKATGDFLIFLNSGDCFADETVMQKCHDCITSFPQFDIYYGDINYSSNIVENGTRFFKHPEILNLAYLKHTSINHQASIIRSSLFKELGNYPETYKLASDYWLFLTCLLKGKKFKHLGLTMINYDVNGMSSKKDGLYESEMALIWNSLIPNCVNDLVLENEKAQLLLKKISVKTALKLSGMFHQVKKARN